MEKVFKEGQLVVYYNGDRFELGRIKTLRTHGAFVHYHSGETAALTDYTDLYPIINDYLINVVSLGGNSLEIHK